MLEKILLEQLKASHIWDEKRKSIYQLICKRACKDENPYNLHYLQGLVFYIQANNSKATDREFYSNLSCHCIREVMQRISHAPDDERINYVKDLHKIIGYNPIYTFNAIGNNPQRPNYCTIEILDDERKEFNKIFKKHHEKYSPEYDTKKTQLKILFEEIIEEVLGHAPPTYIINNYEFKNDQDRFRKKLKEAQGFSHSNPPLEKAEELLKIIDEVFLKLLNGYKHILPPEKTHKTIKTELDRFFKE